MELCSLMVNRHSFYEEEKIDSSYEIGKFSLCKSNDITEGSEQKPQLPKKGLMSSLKIKKSAAV